MATKKKRSGSSSQNASNPKRRKAGLEGDNDPTDALAAFKPSAMTLRSRTKAEAPTSKFTSPALKVAPKAATSKKVVSAPKTMTPKVATPKSAPKPAPKLSFQPAKLLGTNSRSDKIGHLAAAGMEIQLKSHTKSKTAEKAGVDDDGKELDGYLPTMVNRKPEAKTVDQEDNEASATALNEDEQSFFNEFRGDRSLVESKKMEEVRNEIQSSRADQEGEDVGEDDNDNEERDGDDDDDDEMVETVEGDHEEEEEDRRSVNDNMMVIDVTGPERNSRRRRQQTEAPGGKKPKKVKITQDDFEVPELAIFAQNCVRMATCVKDMFPRDRMFAWDIFSQKFTEYTSNGGGKKMTRSLRRISAIPQERDKLLTFMQYGVSRIRYAMGTQARVRTDQFFDIPNSMSDARDAASKERDVAGAINWLLRERKFHCGAVDIKGRTCDGYPFSSSLIGSILRGYFMDPSPRAQDKILINDIVEQQKVPLCLIAMITALVGHSLQEYASGRKVEVTFTPKNLGPMYAEFVKTLQNLQKQAPEYVKLLETSLFEEMMGPSYDVSVQEYDTDMLNTFIANRRLQQGAEEDNDASLKNGGTDDGSNSNGVDATNDSADGEGDEDEDMDETKNGNRSGTENGDGNGNGNKNEDGGGGGTGGANDEKLRLFIEEEEEIDELDNSTRKLSSDLDLESGFDVLSKPFQKGRKASIIVGSDEEN
ncbi:hypothetical protein D9757_014050 [Collybiopsis confluens]|uniref:DUF6532 domain-containing protein n=1 Tax=Collybiopsis confluens TaxID=2823264 RepID=A0A8H5FRN6_9AGAR|nr:hypothetical protein D9757_014050 [Collybiopsis confluens]